MPEFDAGGVGPSFEFRAASTAHGFGPDEA